MKKERKHYAAEEKVPFYGAKTVPPVLGRLEDIFN